MNYEKILKDALNSKATPFEVSSWIEEQFPELAESEDEKIRKEIVRFIQMEVEDEIVGNKWLAWLGKQGDYANFRDKAQVGDRITKNEDGVLVNLSQMNRVAKKNEKQGEKKPADSYCKENCKGYQETGKCFADGMCNAKREAEQKPKENNGNIGGISSNWSEEDETALTNTIIMLKEGASLHFIERDITKAVDWLQSLQDRVQPQPKQDWSEKDGVLLESISVLQNTGHWVLADKLKSLRPQSQWKPSELQLGCLSDAIEYYNSLGYPASKLKELLDDLRKLKEGEV